MASPPPRSTALTLVASPAPASPQVRQDSSSPIQEKPRDPWNASLGDNGKRKMDILMMCQQHLSKEIQEQFQVPGIVVVGDQSHGKSTLLNAIMNVKLLPEKSSRCTRCPLRVTIKRRETPLLKEEEEQMKDLLIVSSFSLFVYVQVRQWLNKCTYTPIR